MLVLAGEAQLLAEVSGVLVGRETGGRGRDLEQDALRLAEVDRVEVVAVDHGGHVHSGRAHALLPRHVVGVGRVPGDVMHGSGALDAVGIARFVGPVETARRALQAVAACRIGGEEAERVCQQLTIGLEWPADVRPGAFDPGDRMLGRDLGVARLQRRVPGVGDDQLEAEAVVVGEAERAFAALTRIAALAEALLPELQRCLARDPELDRVDHARAGSARLRAGELEPGEDRPGRALLVAEVQVVGLGRVEVDRLLDHPQTQHTSVEIDVSLGVAGDHRDVV